MTRQAFRVLMLLSLTLGSAAAALQVCETCKFADRGNRIEGVEERQQVSGGSFELLSVHYQDGAGSGGPGGPIVHLYFWLPEPGELEEIKVWQPGRRYRMEPAKKTYGGGLGGFSWERAAVIDPMQVPIESLYVRVRDGQTYLPALVTTGEPKAPRGGYAFVFHSGAGIDAECTIAQNGTDTEIQNFECFEEFGGEIAIQWDGRDANGNRAADGRYVLRIEGDMLAETIRPLEASVVFQHRGRLQ